jgi:hypothetical protein
MSTNLKSTRRLAAIAMLVTAGLAGCADFVTAPSGAIQQQIEAARTPADHQKLADYYLKEAAAARTKAAEHRQMGKSYAANPPGGRGGGSMASHCNSTAASYDEIASRYEAMAATHKEMSSLVKP